MKIQILVFILSFFLSSCISKKQFSIVVEERDKLAQEIEVSNEKLREVENELRLCKEEIMKILETSGSSLDWALITSVQNKIKPLFYINTNCRNELSTNFSQIGNNIENLFKNKPVNGISRNEQFINENTRKWLFISNGYSDILKSIPRFETVIYIVSLYFDTESGRFAINIDYLPMVAGGKGDKRVFLYSESQINLYSETINGLIDDLVKNQIKINKCLKKIP